MPFNTSIRGSANYDSPEALFRDRRNRKVQGLLSHQSDILRRYLEEAINLPNVAIELPTGSGKTLVGLLIAEFRRITKRERVLYLCPTKQLVQQVCHQSIKKYGIDATAFVGKVKDYEPAAKASFLNSDTIAVAPYSALFNTNPFFTSTQLIILDDAHAAENYIASNWSVEISRASEKSIYSQLLNIIIGVMPTYEMKRFEGAYEEKPKWVEMMPGHLQARVIDEIQAFLNENISQDSKLIHPWKQIRAHLHACQIYVSPTCILLRPLIPPSVTHPPFAGARQRVYMSATLGLAGDLERITGVDSFCRLPIPHGWDKQGIGRRFFMLPQLSLENNQIDLLVTKLAEQADKALILTPDKTRVEKWTNVFKESKIFTAADLEETIETFIAKQKAIAILANRYDGLDFLDDACRLLVLDGLPKAINLQEVYQITRMSAANLYMDRIRTRIVQAIGRCTRSATDYAAVVVLGDDFFDWFVVSDRQSLFHPELQGELLFGIQQKETSKVISDFLENLRVFLEHGQDWNSVDGFILQMRDSALQAPIPGQEKLLQSAQNEVRFMYALWDGDHRKAMELAEAVAQCLSGNELKGMRGQWYYQAAVNADKLASIHGASDYLTKAIDLYERALNCLPALSWLHLRIRDLSRQTANEPKIYDVCPFLEANLERMENVFQSRGYTSIIRFENDAKSIYDGLRSGDSKIFEEAHRLLGELLGFRSKNSSGNGTPDPWWISTDELCIVFEDKSNSKPENAISVDYTRQAVSHEKWIRSNETLSQSATIYSSLISTQSKIHRDVPTYADDIGYWYIDDFRTFSEKAIGVLRSCRTCFTGIGKAEWRDAARATLKTNKLDPMEIIIQATACKLRDVRVE
jgi:tetratricopeptide (TPR) repeat protein